MPTTELAKTDPLFQFLQHNITQRLESITLKKNIACFKWYDSEKNTIYSKDLPLSPDEFVFLMNTLRKLEAIQTVFNQYPIGITAYDKES